MDILFVMHPVLILAPVMLFLTIKVCDDRHLMCDLIVMQGEWPLILILGLALDR